MKSVDKILNDVTAEVTKQGEKDFYKVFVPYKNDHNFQQDEMDNIFEAIERINTVGLFECSYNATFMEFHLKRVAK